MIYRTSLPPLTIAVSSDEIAQVLQELAPTSTKHEVIRSALEAGLVVDISHLLIAEHNYAVSKAATATRRLMKRCSKIEEKQYRVATKAKLRGKVFGSSVTVFRVVDSKGFGYKKSLDAKVLNAIDVDLSNYDKRRPLPHDDNLNIVEYGRDWFFGFASIDQLKSWFTLDERNAGTFFKGKIEEIEVDSEYVVHGKTQVIFHCHYASIKDSHPMNAFDTPEDRLKPFLAD